MPNKQYKKVKQLFEYLLSMMMVLILAVFIFKYVQEVNLFSKIDIDITGNTFVYESTIRERIQPFINGSIFQVDLDGIQSAVSEIEYVETAQVSRVLPNCLVLQVVERSPLLLINLNEENFILDRKGKLLSAEKRAIGYFPVPIITIPPEFENEFTTTENISALFDFILLTYPGFYNNLSEVLIQDNLWIFYSDNNTRIYTRPEKLLTQFTVLKNFERTVYPLRQIKDYSYIDLTIKNQVVVKEKYRKG